MYNKRRELLFITVMTEGEDTKLSRVADFGSAKEAMAYLQELSRYSPDLEIEITTKKEEEHYAE